MVSKNDISTLVKSFYSEHPFPWFQVNNFNLKEDLFKQASDYAKMIYINMPYDKSVLDVGCGTGQFSCFLGLKASSVLGIDFSTSSISKANELRERLGLKNVSFENCDILKDTEKISDRFDYIFCNGVLHHLDNPEEGFLSLSRLLKPGSYIVIGIYNSYGRFFFKMKRNRRAQRTKGLLQRGCSEDKELNWNLDQYCHPHEVSFSFKDIMCWFSKNSIEYCSSAPPIECFSGSKLNTRPFNLAPRHAAIISKLKSFLVQLSWIWSLSDSGGYSVIIGRRNS